MTTDMTFFWQLVWTAALLVAAVIDIRERRIPNWITYPGTLLALAAAAFAGRSSLVSALIGAGFALIFFGLLYAVGLLISRGRGVAFGLGDVKLAVFIGAFCGWPLVAPALLAGILAGGLAALINIAGRIARRTYRPGATMAYGPYLVIGGLAGLWASDLLLAFWQGMSR